MTVIRARKKPVEIEAMQFDGTPKSAEDICAWAGTVGAWSNTTPTTLDIETLESKPGEALRACPGDYIIRGVKGEFYPCKPDIFLATYEVLQPKPEPNFSGWPRANTGTLRVQVRMWNVREDEAGAATIDFSEDMHRWAERVAKSLFNVSRGRRMGGFYVYRKRPDGVTEALGTGIAPIVEDELLTIMEPIGHGA